MPKTMHSLIFERNQVGEETKLLSSPDHECLGARLSILIIHFQVFSFGIQIVHSNIHFPSFFWFGSSILIMHCPTMHFEKYPLENYELFNSHFGLSSQIHNVFSVLCSKYIFIIYFKHYPPKHYSFAKSLMHYISKIFTRFIIYYCHNPKSITHRSKYNN